LETDKRAVEIAIEQDEEAAMQFIEEQINDDGSITCLLIKYIVSSNLRLNHVAGRKS
jgi:hypothetical protein